MTPKLKIALVGANPQVEKSGLLGKVQGMGFDVCRITSAKEASLLPKVDAAILSIDFMDHNMLDASLVHIRDRDIPHVRGTRKWSDMQRKIEHFILAPLGLTHTPADGKKIPFLWCNKSLLVLQRMVKGEIGDRNARTLLQNMGAGIPQEGDLGRLISFAKSRGRAQLLRGESYDPLTFDWEKFEADIREAVCASKDFDELSDRLKAFGCSYPAQDVRTHLRQFGIRMGRDGALDEAEEMVDIALATLQESEESKQQLQQTMQQATEELDRLKGRYLELDQKFRQAVADKQAVQAQVRLQNSNVRGHGQLKTELGALRVKLSEEKRLSLETKNRLQAARHQLVRERATTTEAQERLKEEFHSLKTELAHERSLSTKLSINKAGSNEERDRKIQVLTSKLTVSTKDHQAACAALDEANKVIEKQKADGAKHTLEDIKDVMGKKMKLVVKHLTSGEDIMDVDDAVDVLSLAVKRLLNQ